MWIVRLALRRPYTVAALCLVLFLLGSLCVTRMRTDVLPTIDLPVVSVVWSYPGLSAEDMERRVVYITERSLSTSVDGIQRIESQSIEGIGIVKVYFEPGYDIGSAIAQINAACNSITRGLPPGMTPPTILRFNASNVPVAQLTLTGGSEQELYDSGQNFMRLRLFTIPGLQTPAPFGGRARQVTVDIDPQKLAAARLSPQDIVTAIQNSNVILPAGLARIGTTEFDVALNGSPRRIEEFNDIPLRVEGGRTVLLGSVAHVYDGYANQTNIARVDGQRATYLAILKKSDASTLAVVEATRNMLPSLKALGPPGTEITLDFDQSVFVRAAIHSVLREALIAAGLVSLMILFFLGSWRSTLVVATSIPVAILVGILGLFLTGQTLNVMTLGGLALSIGMLVDDATVEVENIHRNHGQGKTITRSILDGAKQVALPALAATSTLCIVFFPVVLLTGPARFLFVPLALAVVFPLAASYVLSRTLVPALARKLMSSEDEGREPGPGHEGHGQRGSGAHEKPRRARNPRGLGARLGRASERFNHWRDEHFERFSKGYTRALSTALEHRAWVLGAFGLLVVISLGLMVFVVGLDFFPNVDTGQMRLHVRAPAGTRLEETERRVSEVETAVRQLIPAAEVRTVTDNIGVPTSYNLAFVPSDNVASNDAEVRIELAHGHASTRGYMDTLRAELGKRFPDMQFYFQDADIVSQVLNFGVSAPVDIQVTGRNADQTLQVAQQVVEQVRRIPGAVDVRINQSYNRPTLRVDVDRQRALALNVTERDVANSLITSLSSSLLTSPSSWVNPQTSVNYSVVVQTPLSQVSRVDELLATPISPAAGLSTSMQAGDVNAAPYLGAIAQLGTSAQRASIRHETVQPVVDVQCAVAGRDLGGVARDIQRVVDGLKLPERVEVHVRGQSESMFSSFGSLGLGLVLAIVLVYFLLVVLFQSWKDPLIILTAVPGALVGILWMLSITGTSLNVESFMGTIMAVGIAVSNSILLVSFANESRQGKDKGQELSSVDAAREAARTRLRPVLMTALAMILGMLPMALGLGEGGDQNAPLGRAVIGGLLVATLVTLFVVPVVYSLLRKQAPDQAARDAEIEREGASDDDSDEGSPDEHSPKVPDLGRYAPPPTDHLLHS